MTPLLSPQQQRVAALIVQGCTNKGIANELGLAERTVNAHVSAILVRLGVNNRTSAAVRLVMDGHLSVGKPRLGVGAETRRPAIRPTSA